MNQFKQTAKGALERGRGSAHRVPDTATIADVLFQLFEHEAEDDLFHQILAGISEEIATLGIYLQLDVGDAGNPDVVGSMLVRLSRRLDLALAFEQHRADDPDNYERDFEFEADERPSGEYAVAIEVPPSTMRPASARRGSGAS